LGTHFQILESRSDSVFVLLITASENIKTRV